MNVEDSTPIIVGVGQFTERLNSPSYRALCAVEIAAEACRRAFLDASSLEVLASSVDLIATTRTFADSTPQRSHPFGKSNNFPRSIAQRLGLNPARALWEKAGGDSPQRLVNEIFERLADGEVQVAVITGAEDISTARFLKSEGKVVDWSETVDGQVDDRGLGLKGMITHLTRMHRLVGAPSSYAICENARRRRMNLSREAYAQQMGRLFSPFTKVAAANPYSSSEQREYSADELSVPSERNRLIADPYPQRLVARDQVNQGAALIATTVGLARKLGIPESKWTYLHGYADAVERGLMDREDLGESKAAKFATRAALSAAGIAVDEISFFDFYSCFPIAVSSVASDELEMSPDDIRALTVTGGLPFFGGPGNNYSMHAIASMVEKVRAAPGAKGLVGANGGILSKYSVGVYSSEARAWARCDSAVLQARIDSLPAPKIAYEPEGEAVVESYTTVYEKGVPAYAVVVGRLVTTNERFLANSIEGDEDTLREMLQQDPLGRRFWVTARPQGNRFTFSASQLRQWFPAQSPVFKPSYEYCVVERKGNLLEVVINRPDVRNCLHPMANDELADIFDAFEADPTLWVAILSGAGTEAFCAGNDLKYTASGKPMWIPLTGFGGLTRRQRTKPVIAAVNGFAMGGGTEIALACDIVVADEKASFALTEVRVGLFAGAGGLVRLPRQLPRKIATELILTGRRLRASDAEKYGFVNRVVAAGEALDGAREIAAEILLASPTSVRISMESMNDAAAHPSDLGALQNVNRGRLDELLTSEDFFEGLAAFAEKRSPRWKNR